MLGVLAFATVNASAGIPLNWSDEEVACAATIDVALRAASRPSSPTYERRLAWLADVIVSGMVKELENIVQGAYRSVLVLEVGAVWKGGPLDGSDVRVCLEAGPSYSAVEGRVVHIPFHDESTFEIGEEVLLFLTDGAELTAETPYVLPVNHYYMIYGVKWSLTDTVAIHGLDSEHQHPTEWLYSEISIAVETQRWECQSD
jgi:hypothetical protein